MLSKSEAIQKHRDMWNRIAEMIEQGVVLDHIAMYKSKALVEMGETPGKIAAGCWCCQYANEQDLECEDCPLVWCAPTCDYGYGLGIEDDSISGEFYQINRATKDRNMEKMYKLALKIANMPEREDSNDNR